MEKLTEKINAFKISKTLKNYIIKVSELEEINIQQTCRKLIKIGMSKYPNIINEQNDKIKKNNTHDET